jgi:7,8-dihydropterin-6-yl-methyl-4-(beta-D-ribofuranosyl)aminobenzene 5'-phosphate synthase
MDDYCSKRGLVGEHGLSLYIETGVVRLLFDSGQSGAFVENARHLGIDLPSLDAIVLSHGHYDHGGGLAALAGSLRRPVPLFAGMGFSDARYSKVGDELNSIGLESLFGNNGKIPVCIVDSVKEIAQGLYILPKAERSDGTSAATRFKRICEGNEVADAFDDELSLAVPDAEGISVITGCAHRGIVNIVRQAMAAFPGLPLKAVIGGLHLVDSSPAALAGVASGLASLEPRAIHCAHCTGLPGYADLAAALPGKVVWLSCGASIDL